MELYKGEMMRRFFYILLSTAYMLCSIQSTFGDVELKKKNIHKMTKRLNKIVKDDNLSEEKLSQVIFSLRSLIGSLMGEAGLGKDPVAACTKIVVDRGTDWSTSRVAQWCLKNEFTLNDSYCAKIIIEKGSSSSAADILKWCQKKKYSSATLRCAETVIDSNSSSSHTFIMNWCNDLGLTEEANKCVSSYIANGIILASDTKEIIELYKGICKK